MALLSRRATSVLLVCLSLILVGTCIVLGSVWSFFHVDRRAMITPEEVQMIVASWASAAGSAGAAASVASEANKVLPAAMRISVPRAEAHSGRAGGEPSRMRTARIPASSTRDPASALDDLVPRLNTSASAIDPAVYEGHFTPGTGSKNIRPGEKIPRLIHQTWKTDMLPERWTAIRDECQKIHSDYDYILWTDDNSRNFIAKHYSWFLPVFDGYPHPIQRADAIRYFVLHHFGGIYMDLDIGCLKPMTPLLSFEAILPETAPIGVSNDLMMITPQHPFMKRLLNHLVLFNHNYVLNYPTVMFSTGPMLVSASYALWVDAKGVSLPSDRSHPNRGRSGVRVLPKSLYGKNLPPDLARKHAFFKHFYGSSWHANDAGFIQALGKRGKYLFLLGVAILVYGLLRRASIIPPLTLGRIAGPLLRLIYSLSRAAGFNPSRTRFSGGLGQIPFGRQRSGFPEYTQAERENLLTNEDGGEAFAMLNQPKRAESFSTRIDMPSSSRGTGVNAEPLAQLHHENLLPNEDARLGPPQAVHQRSMTLDAARTPSPSRLAQAFLPVQTESPPGSPLVTYNPSTTLPGPPNRRNSHEA